MPSIGFNNGCIESFYRVRHGRFFQNSALLVNEINTGSGSRHYIYSGICISPLSRRRTPRGVFPERLVGRRAAARVLLAEPGLRLIPSL